MEKIYKYYKGTSLRDYQAYAKFKHRFFHAMNQMVRKIVVVSGALGVIAVFVVASHIATKHFWPKIVTAQVPLDMSNEMFRAKIESLKDGVVNELLSCEGAGYNEDSGLVTYDPTDAQYDSLVSNGKKTIVDKGEMSYGILQFKKSTVITYVKLKDSKVITGKEALLIALDKKSAAELSKFVMFETKGKASGDWKNCARTLNLDAKIDVIKQLAK